MQRLFNALLVAVAAISISACAVEATPEAVEGGRLGGLNLALTGEQVANAGAIEVAITEAGQSAPLVVDSFTPNSSEVERNFRIPPGTYDIGVKVFDPAGALIAGGTAGGVTVSPGDNAVSVVLVPTAEDLSDVLIAFAQPPVKIGSIAADGNTDQDGTLSVTAIVASTADFDPDAPPSVSVFAAILLANGPDGAENDHLSFSLEKDATDETRFVGSVPADWIGRATMQVTVIADGQVVDTTTKDVIGIPSDTTLAIADVLAKNLSVLPDGTLAKISGLSTTDFKLDAAGISELNSAIAVLNKSIAAGTMVLDADMGNVINPLMFATLGYWQCVFKILKCEALSVGCIAAVPGALIGCAAACEASIGLACVLCVSAAGGGAVALCDSAITCWQEAKKQRCIP